MSNVDKSTERPEEHRMTTARVRRTILVADDDAVSGRILEKSLTDWGFRVVLVRNGDEAWRALQRPEIRLALLDWVMPGIDGVELCRRVREKPKSHYAYLILLTARDDPRDIVDGLEAGADDYMTKPVNYLELRARLQTGLRITNLEDKLLRTQRRLTHLATRDGLTGLWNRRVTIKFLEEDLAHASRDGSYVGVIMADVDHFKKINDSGGHQLGDRTLKTLAKRINRSVRTYDKVGRYGGDEVLIILPDCGLKRAARIAERLRRVSARQRIRGHSLNVPLTLSVGCTASDCFVNPTADKLIRASDRALYKAKEAGRNFVALSHALKPNAKEKIG
jgi:diguanylate cyclase (GGDEF)-like protein